jgi:DNA uptake protein ComE-like DNA-binding protein
MARRHLGIFKRDPGEGEEQDTGPREAGLETAVGPSPPPSDDESFDPPVGLFDQERQQGAGGPPSHAEPPATDADASEQGSGAAEAEATAQEAVAADRGAGNGAGAIDEDAARGGAAAWLRTQIKDIERRADERVKAEVEERTRLEVEAARTAAEQHFAAELNLREEELEQEREEKTRVIESSARRLAEIEERALAAADRVAAAEHELASEAARLRENVAAIQRDLEERFEEIEGKIGAVTERASGASARARASDPEPAPEVEPVTEERPPAPSPEPEAESDIEPFDQEGASEPGEAAEPPPDGMLSLNQADFDELRGLGMSITQAKRVLRFREEKSFTSLDELDGVPGFSKEFLERVKGRLAP